MPWYLDWFSSEFYDILYKHRDEEEASQFIGNIFKLLPLEDACQILDMACGNGRHSLALAPFGQVWGIDINEAQILKAKKRNIEKAQFLVHDMRSVVKTNHFDVVFNLFSSFGYFNNRSEDLKVLQSVVSNLKPGGFFVQDYLNAPYVVAKLKETEEIIEGNFRFNIQRSLEGSNIKKEIYVEQNGKAMGVFKEELMAYTASDLTALYEESGLKLLHSFGDYNLRTFDASDSPRWIGVSQKTK
jgi:SAM-dependent methyltransferase